MRKLYRLNSDQLWSLRWKTSLHCPASTAQPNSPWRRGDEDPRDARGRRPLLGLLIYFSPRLFFGTIRPQSERPQLKTGGTSAIFVVAENLLEGKYAKDKGVDIVCESGRDHARRDAHAR